MTNHSFSHRRRDLVSPSSCGATQHLNSAKTLRAAAREKTVVQKTIGCERRVSKKLRAGGGPSGGGDNQRANDSLRLWSAVAGCTCYAIAKRHTQHIHKAQQQHNSEDKTKRVRPSRDVFRK